MKYPGVKSREYVKRTGNRNKRRRRCIAIVCITCTYILMGVCLGEKPDSSDPIDGGRCAIACVYSVIVLPTLNLSAETTLFRFEFGFQNVIYNGKVNLL